jgi:MFS transporter, PAT family, beta-lactamase induction signal transducer AmpG
LMASLTMLIGTLGRGALGELIEERGFAYVFILTALLGLVAVAASIAEALRMRFMAKAPAATRRDAADS